ncbi:MAG TPA: hypothetical protein VMS43_13100 [Allosphingosinicella sp.]|nr:hypothetical protein [Allosphingosinicella sp.]
MHGAAIAAGALGRDGLGLLLTDFGRTRLTGVARPPREPRAGVAELDDAARATRP